MMIAAPALGQPVKKLPGGAVMKPGRPAPIVPLAVSDESKPLQPLIGKFTLTTPGGESAAVECAAILEGRWLRCDVHAPAGAAAALLGWDHHAAAYRAFVVDSHGGSRLYRGTLRGGKLTLRAAGSPRVSLALSTSPMTGTIRGEVWTFSPAAPR
jgi:hypothetical protein